PTTTTATTATTATTTTAAGRRRLCGAAARAVAGDADRSVGVDGRVERYGRADPDRADLDCDQGLIGGLSPAGPAATTGAGRCATALLRRVPAGAITGGADRGVAGEGCVSGRGRV